MLIKLGAILLVSAVSSAHMISQRWDVAVAVGDEIKLLNYTGSLLGTAVEQFTKLKALSYDYVRHQFLVSNMEKLNDTIFKIQLNNKQTAIVPIVKDLPDDVQGIAIDPLTDILYWTDSDNRSINYVSLKHSSDKLNNLLYFKDEIPHDIAVDSCKRYLYWTNLNIMKPSVARISLNTMKQEVLVSDDLFSPTGITIDYENDRIYWGDLRQGIYFRIESTKMDGTERQILFEGTHQKPYGVAVDSDYVYWTDVINNELNRKSKHDDSPPECIHKFDAIPQGVVVHDTGFVQREECKDVYNAIENFKGTTTEFFLANEEKNESNECLKRGEFIDGGCQCHRGYTGTNCEISLCYNFCVHGECHFTSLAYPQCKCPPGFMGARCQKNICDGFCLNDGKCSIAANSTSTPICKCTNGFSGIRCQESTEFSKICELYCSRRHASSLLDEESEMLCKCQDGSFKIVDNSVRVQESAEQTSIWQYTEKPAIIVLSVCMVVMFVLIIVLASFVCKLRRRPRIKKRIIVNKNVTPLTYRPQAPEQCEITIENCCNMNVCETPCFEPPKLRAFHSKKEEKKELLGNMENGEDLY
ncbi:protein cueball [Agrilus planipennis]|uniref:Protein cueball n=1 Tax=Agrilus planipennis TaxID=224129 RepID=A0A1W4X1L9_AGRPL|nr:protein cueball [Agrilus planipennis]